MNIIQYPESLSFVGNLKDIILSDITSDGIEIKLHETEKSSGSILHEIYRPDATGGVVFEIKSVLTDLFQTNVPPMNTLVSELADVLKKFTLEIGTEALTFSVLNGGVCDLQGDTAAFLEQNFLTWQPFRREIQEDGFDVLTYYPQEECLLKFDIRFEDQSCSEHVIGLTDGKYYSFCISPLFLFPLFHKKIVSFDVWIESIATYQLTQKVSYTVTPLNDRGEKYLYTNSLGAIDTVVFTGQFSKKTSTKAVFGLMHRKTIESNVDQTIIYKQNTGYLLSESAETVRDFLLAKERYHFVNDRMVRIVIEESENEFVDYDLNAYEFEYQHADQARYLNLNRQPETPTRQLPPFWNKVVACFDKRKGNVIYDRVQGLQITVMRNLLLFPEITGFDVFDKNNTAYWLPDIPEKTRIWPFDQVTGTYTINYATDLCSRVLFFRDITGNNINTTLPIIVYKEPLSDHETEVVLKYLKEYYFLDDKEDAKLLIDHEPADPDSVFIIDHSKTK